MGDLAEPGERPHFFVIPRNRVTAGLLAYKGYLDAEDKAWPRIIFGAVEYEGYDEAWEFLEHPAHQASWRMQPWVAEALVEHGRDDIFAAIRPCPGRTLEPLRSATLRRRSDPTNSLGLTVASDDLRPGYCGLRQGADGDVIRHSTTVAVCPLRAQLGRDPA